MAKSASSSHAVTLSPQMLGRSRIAALRLLHPQLLYPRFLHSSAASWKLVNVIVPGMGDSIVDGVLRGVTSIGTKVKVDDIIATIETDKVSIEVRSPEAGVVKEVKAAVDAVVVVGQMLVVVDSDGAASATAAASAASAPSTPAPTKVAPPPSPPSSSSSSSSSSSGAAHARVPSIAFKYGGGREEKAAAHPSPPSHKATTPSAAAAPHHSSAPSYPGGNYNAYLSTVMPSKVVPSAKLQSYLDLPPLYGRPLLSPKEIAAIESGGAY